MLQLHPTCSSFWNGLWVVPAAASSAAAAVASFYIYIQNKEEER